MVRDKRKSGKYSMANREMENGGRKKRDMTKNINFEEEIEQGRRGGMKDVA